MWQPGPDPASSQDRERLPPRSDRVVTVPARSAPVAIGVDVVDVERFSRMVALRGPALGGAVFTVGETARCHGSVRRLAARFAAKEAAAKALGLGIGPIAFREVEVRTGSRGEPTLALDGAAREAAEAQGLEHWAVSLSHGAGSVVAVVVATGRGLLP